MTAVVTWRDAGASPEREVRQSTIVAESTRGVGIPDFQLDPFDMSATVAPGNAVCFTHVLTNFGVPDNFDLWFERMTLIKANGDEQPAITDPFLVDDRTVRIPYIASDSSDKAWLAHAWMGPDAWTQANAWRRSFNNDPNAGLPGDFMRDVDADPPLEGPIDAGLLTTVEKDEDTQFAVCYRPFEPDKPPSEGTTHIHRPLVRSQMWASLVGFPDTSTQDENGVLGLTHTIEVSSQERGIYLVGSDPHENGVAQGEPPFTFDDLLPPARTLPDFAHDYDPPGEEIPGFGLRRPANSQVSGDTLVDWIDNDDDVSLPFSEIEVRLWTSWQDAILFGSTQQKDLDLLVSVCILEELQDPTSCRSGTEQDAEISYVHDVAGWRQHSVTLTWPEQQTVGILAGEALRLRIACTSSGGGDRPQDCHLAFDTEAFASRLEVSP